MSYFNADQIASTGGPNNTPRGEAEIRAAERVRIRRELRDAIGARTEIAFSGTNPAYAQPVRMVDAEALLAAIDRIIPEAG